MKCVGANLHVRPWIPVGANLHVHPAQPPVSILLILSPEIACFRKFKTVFLKKSTWKISWLYHAEKKMKIFSGATNILSCLITGKCRLSKLTAENTRLRTSPVLCEKPFLLKCLADLIKIILLSLNLKNLTYLYGDCINALFSVYLFQNHNFPVS